MTLQKKFGNLPLKYVRTSLEAEEVSVFEGVVKKYCFNIEDTDDVPEVAGPSTKKLCLEQPPKPIEVEEVSLLDSEEDRSEKDEEEDFQTTRRRQIKAILKKDPMAFESQFC